MPCVVHKLKILPGYYRSVVNGSKPFEVRLNDRDYHAGDFLFLCEWSPESGFTGKEVVGHVTCVFGDPHFLAPGYVVLGLDNVHVFQH